MNYHKRNINNYYIDCEIYNQETEEYDVMRGYLDQLLYNEEIEEIHNSMADLVEDVVDGSGFPLEQELYREISYAIESVLKEGFEIQTFAIFRSLTDSNFSDPLYFYSA